MRRGPRLAPVALTVQENNQLIEWTRRLKTSQALALRARIVMVCAQGASNRETADRLRITKQTVGKWRSRFLERRLDGLLDEPRPGAPRQHGDAKIEQLIATTLNERPREATHWSTRLLAKKLRVSQSTVSRVWRAFGLQPHRAETFKLSTDPLFIDKVRDIVGLYLNPPTKAMVLCVDEKGQIQALDRTQPILPLAPGLPNAVRMTTSGMERRRCLRRWISLPAMSSVQCIGVTAPESSLRSCKPSKPMSRRNSMCT